MSLEKLVKKIITSLAKDDYPVLNTQLFVKTWLEYVFDRILQLVSIPEIFGKKLLDKLHYL